MALKNIDEVINRLVKLGAEEPKYVHLSGEVLTLRQIREEILKWTPIGQIHAKIWSRPWEEIEDEIRKARDSLHKA